MDDDKHGPSVAGVRGLSHALGWCSLGLAGASLAAPRQLARVIGVRPTPEVRATMIGVGLQEFFAGTGILRGRPQPWLWSRVVGDAMHLGLLGRALRSRGTDRGRTASAMGALAGVAVVDLVAATGARDGQRAKVRTRTVTTVNRGTDQVYRAWKDLEGLPRFMQHLVSVESRGGRRSHWVAGGPGGTRIEWDAEVVDDVPGCRLAWRSLAGADVDNRGAVSFAPAPDDQGTEVTVELVHVVPGGRLGRAVARMFGEHPAQQASDDLRRFKQIMETGEVVRSSGTPEGSVSDRQWRQEPTTPR